MISRTARRPSLPGFIVQCGAEGDLRSPERENLTSALARGVFGLRIFVVNFSSFFCFCFCFGLIGTCLLSARQVHAEQSPGCVPQTLHGQWGAALWQAVAKANIIYVGETHDRPGDHAYELRLVREMIRRRIAFAIGWEMFDQTQQPLLDAWDRGAISLQQLFRDTGFDRAWAVYSPIYSKILKTAQRSARTNVALNATPALVRKVAHGQSLSHRQRAQLPRGFTTSEASYRNFVSLMGKHPDLPAGHLRSFFAAQNVWDQTMADRILQFNRLQSGAKLVVLAGRGHVAGGFGVPFYVEQKRTVQQLILFPDDLQ